jgi:hypothetical protein
MFRNGSWLTLSTRVLKKIPNNNYSECPVRQKKWREAAALSAAYRRDLQSMPPLASQGDEAYPDFSAGKSAAGSLGARMRDRENFLGLTIGFG